MYQIKQILLPLIVCAVFFTTNLSAQELNDSQVAKIESLIKQMTLEEKAGQMNQYTGFFDITGPAPADGDAKVKYDQIKNGLVGSMLNIRTVKESRKLQELVVDSSRLGIPLMFAFDVIHGLKTTFPIPLAEAASWDMAQIKNGARVAAIESAASGIHWTFAPMVDISRDARWGRVMEGAGEDPYLASRIARARVQGFQGDDLSADNTILACAKHFAAYGFAEAGKDYNTADLGLSTLYNVVLPPFKAAADAGAATFMNSFNELNGIPATGDAFLQRDILKGSWGFKGLMVSDWGSIGELIPHGFAVDGPHAATLAANAGSDIDMESRLYIQHLPELVRTGKVDEAVLDDAVRRILRAKMVLGLFDDPYSYCNEEKEKNLVFSQPHLDAALDMAKRSIVLLKNDNNMLPLQKSGQKIGVIGHLAESKTSPLGNWRLAADDGSAVSVLEGLNNYNGNTYTYQQGVKLYSGTEFFINELEINNTDRTGIDEAVAMAKDMDVVIMVLGEHGLQSGEGRSRANIDLPGLQQELLEAVFAVNKNVVLVLNNGRPLAIEWAGENVPAIVEAWQLGTRAGDAIAEVLYGDYNPSGKLPVTFPRSLGQVPLYYNYKNTGRPGPIDLVFWSHYNDETNDPMYPFGHGLSYSNFEYQTMNVSVNNQDKNIVVQVAVANTSEVAGEEVIQLYIRDKVASVTRPVKELKSFQKVSIPGNTAQVYSFVIDERSLGFYNNQGKFIMENGDFSIMVGGSSNTALAQDISISW